MIAKNKTKQGIVMISGIYAIETDLSLRLVTGEFEILSHLYRHGPTRSKDLSRVTKVSIANFQGILRRLKGDGIIVSVCDPEDRRVRLFDLSDCARQSFDLGLGDDRAEAAEPEPAARGGGAPLANGASRSTHPGGR